MSETNYVPGICNINPAEIKKRQLAGHMGLVASILFVTLALFAGLDWYVRLLIFIPAFVAATGYLQAKNKFCVGYAGAGKQHADDGSIESITSDTALQADKRKAQTINAQSTLVASLAAAVFAIVPLAL